jgi:hypothetical protein
MTTYPETAAIVALAKSVWEGNKEAAKVSYAVSAKLKAELKKLLGKDIEEMFITDGDVRHIRKKHGQGEAFRGQVDIVPEDFALIPFILNDFDTAMVDSVDKLGNVRLLFTKLLGSRAYVATIERGNRRIQVRTFWKMLCQVPRAGETPP